MVSFFVPYFMLFVLLDGKWVGGILKISDKLSNIWLM